MAYFGDTNVVFRWATPSDPMHFICQRVVRKIYDEGEEVVITPQVLMEFWALATRPVEANGLGMTAEAAAYLLNLLSQQFTILPDCAEIYPCWLKLVEECNIIGRQVYDARLVAVMQTYGITHILTLNGNHFRRFPGIVVVDPASVEGDENPVLNI